MKQSFYERGFKMTVIDKFFILFMDLIIMIFSILLVGIYSGLLDLTYLTDLVQGYSQGIEGIVVGVVLFLISVRVLQLFFRRKKVKQTVITTNQLGNINITLEAINDLVQDIVRKETSVKDVNSRIKVREDGVHIYLNLIVGIKSSIPELSERIQKLLKVKVTEATGVDISKVEIMIKEINKEARMRVE